MIPEEEQQMNWLDIIIIIALIVPIFTGLMQGLIKAALSLAGIIVGVVLASNFYEDFAGVLGFISNEDVANIVAFIIILVLVFIIANVIAFFLRATIKALTLGWVDRAGGAVFGFVMGAILISALLATIVKFFGEGIVTDSALAGFLLDKFPIVLGLLPSQFDSIREFFQ
jgi:membrane protein required for colicin V production